MAAAAAVAAAAAAAAVAAVCGLRATHTYIGRHKSLIMIDYLLVQ